MGSEIPVNFRLYVTVPGKRRLNVEDPFLRFKAQFCRALRQFVANEGNRNRLFDPSRERARSLCKRASCRGQARVDEFRDVFGRVVKSRDAKIE